MIPQTTINILVLIWLIVLIIFTYYSIHKLYKQSSITTNEFADIENTNIIDYITSEQTKDKITDIDSCKNVYDDNIAVRALGYNNCISANTDYYNRNLDINNKYGQSKSLAELCPASTKSNAYMNCMKLLLDKFNTNANIVEKINTDMSNIINKRLTERSDILNNVELTINPFIYNKEQIDFNRHATDDPTTYYSDKYGFSKSVFDNVDTSTIEIYNIDPYIENTFFGIYQAIKGQFIAFNDITLTIEYDNTQPTNTTTTSNTSKKILLTIGDASTTLIYRVANIDFYSNYKNIIKIDLVEQTIQSSQQHDNQTLNSLLYVLGITIPTRILLAVDEFTSTENIVHTSYKLMNINMNTIMIMEKLNTTSHS